MLCGSASSITDWLTILVRCIRLQWLDSNTVNCLKVHLNLHLLSLIQQLYCIQNGSFRLITRECASLNWSESYYLLIVFGSGVLFLFIQSSQPRLPPCIRAGVAQGFVCCTLSTEVISRGNTDHSHCTVLLYLGCCFFFFISGSIVLSERWKNNAKSLPWRSVMLKNKE